MHKYNSVDRANLVVLVSVLVFLNSLVIVALSSSKKCATLYNQQNFRGRPYSLGDGDQQPSLRLLNFFPRSVQVSHGCFLKVFDIYGYNQTMYKDMSSLGWNSNRMLDAGCCECNGCSGAANKLGLSDSCAHLYENPRCDGCSGFRLEFKNGKAAKNFGVWRNRMTSVAVTYGCTLTVFSEPDFRGWRANFTDSSNMMGDNWFKQVLSAKCGCGNAPVTLPTVKTSTRPSITLPTVPMVPWTNSRRLSEKMIIWPTRPAITLPTVPLKTSRPLMTLPTVPITTRHSMLLPTVPTTTRRNEMTLPTEPPTTDSNEFFLDTSEEIEQTSEEDSNNGSWEPESASVETLLQQPLPR